VAELCERIQAIRQRYPTRKDLLDLVEPVARTGSVEAVLGERPFPPHEAALLSAMLGAMAWQAESVHAALDRIEQAFCREA